MAAWPNGPDLSNWLNQPVTSSREGMYEDLVAAAIDVAWGDLDAAKMPDQALPEIERCPPSVRMAVLILAARVDARRQSVNGVVASGDLFYRVSREDPDYRLLMARYAVSAEP